MLGNFFMLFWLPEDLFQNYFFPKNSFRNTIRVSNSLDPDLVGPDPGRNCLERLSVDDRSHCWDANS